VGALETNARAPVCEPADEGLDEPLVADRVAAHQVPGRLQPPLADREQTIEGGEIARLGQGEPAFGQHFGDAEDARERRLDMRLQLRPTREAIFAGDDGLGLGEPRLCHVREDGGQPGQRHGLGDATAALQRAGLIAQAREAGTGGKGSGHDNLLSRRPGSAYGQKEGGYAGY
jgi:hypothetical protein